jgi:photosystem II stability/assembly factor-like uncharacterized protein
MKRYILILVVLVVYASTAQSQWQNIAPNLLGNLYKFVNSSGTSPGGAMCFKAGKLWVGKNELWMTPDSGRSWTKRTPPITNTVILDVDFFDELNGVLTTFSDFAYHTTDGGMNWTKIGTQQFITTCCYLDDANSFLLGTAFTGSFITRDNGLTFQTISSLNLMNCRHNPTGTMVYGFQYASTPPASMFVSSDNGRNWTQRSQLQDCDSYSLSIDKCNDSIVYIANEDAKSSADGLSNIIISTDRGNQWVKAIGKTTDPSTVSPFFTGAISSSFRATYLQTRTDGIWRSTNKGSSWKSIGGPNMSYDNRMITAVDDNIVFTVDSFGSVWATYNSGGDPLNAPGAPGVYKFSAGKIINDTSGVTVYLPIYYHHTGTISSVDLTMHYPAGPLQYLGSLLTYGKSIDVPGTRWPGRARLHFEADDLSAATDSLIAYAVFKWFPLEFDCANIYFDSLSSVVTASVCGEQFVQSGTPFKGIIGAYQWCGEIAAVNSDLHESLFTFAPNPVGESGMIRSTLFAGTVTISVYDIIGKLISTQETYLSPTAPVTLSLGNIASGAYHCSIHTKNMPLYEFTVMHYAK